MANYQRLLIDFLAKLQISVMLTLALQQGLLFMFQKLEQNYGKSNIGYNDPIIYYGNYESDKRFEIVISHSFKRELSLHLSIPLLKLY